jgi:chromatin assembly factor 1 subunit B
MIHPNIPPVSASAHAAVTGQEIVPHPPRAEYLATLSKHTAAVNVVRFSPNGQTLASAGDGTWTFIPPSPAARCSGRGLTGVDGNVILWVQSERPVATFGESSDDSPEKEHWRLQKMLQCVTRFCFRA